MLMVMIAVSARGAALVLGLFAGAAVAQPPTQAVEVVGLDRFLALVERHNPELAAARQQRVLADAEVLVARAYPNPELELGAGPWRSRVGGASGTASQVGVTQPIGLPSVRAPRIGAAPTRPPPVRA